MYDVLFKNGYFRIKPNGHDLSRFDWLTYHKQDGFYYFLPNATTKKLFAATMFKDPDCRISESDLDMLKKFSLSQLRESPVKKMKLFKINGHSFKDYQVTALELMFTHRNFCLFLGPGTGKTAIAVAYLNNVQPKKVLVITPKKVIDQYATEIGKYINYMPDIEIMNFEKIITNEARLVSTHYDCVIIDESHRLKNHSSISSEIVRRMDVENMYLFTGTPQDKNRFEIISQIALFDKRFMPTKALFIERYFEIDTYYRPTFEKRPDELTSMIRLATYGKETDSILKLPDKNEFVIKCKKPSIYKAFAEDKLIIDEEKNISLVCDTPSKVAVKERMMCNGYFTDDNKNIVLTDSEKPKKLEELVKTLDGGIIYTQFDYDAEIINPILTKLGRTWRYVNGKTNAKLSDLFIREFKAGKFEFLVIQSASGNAGLDLSVTNNIVFFSLPTSYVNFNQCQFRTRRLGQTKDCNYYYLTCVGTVDTHIMKLLNDKKSFNARLYKIYQVKKKDVS